MRKEPNIILWDLETLKYKNISNKHWFGISAYPGLTLKATYNSIICAGWKRLGERKVNCINAWDFPKRWNKDINDDYEVVKAIREVLINADGIVTHNGLRFDFKFLQSRLTHHGLPPLPKIPHIDTCRVAKSNLYLFNNRLNTVAEHLGCHLKMENGGAELWDKVADRQKTAMKTMTAYCKQDVRVLEEVFLKLRAFSNLIPNYNLFTGKELKDSFVCPNCGSENVHKNGTRPSKTKLYQRYICTDCATSFRTDAKDLKPRSI